MKTSKGDVEIELRPDLAPKAVENFVTHSKNGYYNGLIFHRIIKSFMIQGGDPTRITSYNVCYTKLLRIAKSLPTSSSFENPLILHKALLTARIFLFKSTVILITYLSIISTYFKFSL